MKRSKNGVVPELEFNKAIKKPIAVKCIQMVESFEVETKEGLMKGAPGDWLMIGIQGEMYPCANDIFKKTYDLVKEK